MNKLEALNEVLYTNLRIKNEGLELNMRHFANSHQPCGTVCCVAGWHHVFAVGTKGLPVFDKHLSCGDDKLTNWEHDAEKWSQDVTFALRGRDNDDIRQHMWEILFGAQRRNDIDKQIYVTRWFIRREEALQEYNRIRVMPRKERRLLNLAA